ncbi:amidohydrolase family protein [Kineosporia sp. J2-2]|uniref:Amidohydrolase family protein n=1 Tax=Kineosporia corallincola TaxID=2835133 RepID=A0ABS5TC87_9ACTN|nr:amidohydrolase family protein [Kineosporia corallincola]MBT0768693.1 amidohydrolase family protein [Kineosporia corallincola]
MRITGARVLNHEGTFVTRESVGFADGVFTVDPEPEGPIIDGAGRWLLPGVFDVHTHITWNDFHQSDRENRTPADRRELTAAALLNTLKGGVTSIRDGGGAGRDLRDGPLPGPRVQISVNLIGPDQAGSVAQLTDAVRRSLDHGAQWIKLIATGGAATSGNALLASHFTREQFAAAARVAETGGARLMVHTWGGESVDWAIEAGAGSLEHAMYLTQDQARRAAEAGLTYVPTLTIYQWLHDRIASGALPGVPLARIADAVTAHPQAVRAARDAGLPIALGSDFGTQQQHGTNLTEIAALIRAGLTGPEALLAATRNGAQLLNDAAGGVIAPGYRADAILLDADPTDPATFADASPVVAVIQNGVPA